MKEVGVLHEHTESDRLVESSLNTLGNPLSSMQAPRRLKVFENIPLRDSRSNSQASLTNEWSDKQAPMTNRDRRLITNREGNDYV